MSPTARRERDVTRAGLHEASRNIVLVLFGSAALAAIIGALIPGPYVHDVRGVTGSLGYDFHTYAWLPLRDLLHGRSPYHLGVIQRAQSGRGPGPYTPVYSTLAYPPLVPLLLAPISVFPQAAAASLFTVVAALCPAAALYLFGIRDWRCYASMYLWWPVFLATHLGTLSSALLLAVAALWRWRDHSPRAAASLGVAVAAKLFLWPMGMWLIVTRRHRAGVFAGLLASGLVAGSWLLIGWRGIGEYPALLKAVSSLDADQGQSLIADAVRLGLSRAIGYALMLAMGGGLMVLMWKAHRAGLERLSFSLATFLCLAWSPVVWSHYLVLLAVPLALCCSTWSTAWLIPCLLVVAPDQIGHEHHGSFLAAPFVTLVVVLLVFGRAYRATSSEADRETVAEHDEPSRSLVAVQNAITARSGRRPGGTQ